MFKSQAKLGVTFWFFYAKFIEILVEALRKFNTRQTVPLLRQKFENKL